MLRNIAYYLIYLCLTFKVGTAISSTKDYPASILKISDFKEQERELVFLIKNELQGSSLDKLSDNKNSIVAFVNKNRIENGQAFIHFAESLYQRRLINLRKAEAEMVKAIDLARQKNDDYLLYQFYSHLAFLQTDDGNPIDALTNYGLARKEAILLSDPKFQQIIDVNISDVYYKNNFFSQSLSYLNQAEALGARYRLDNITIDKVIYYNKAENFFRLKEVDSLDKYNRKLNSIKGKIYKLYTYQKRTGYYLHLLRYDYKGAIKIIKSLKNDSLYNYNNQDQLNLANAYFDDGKLDSAASIINDLLKAPLEFNHPEIKYHLYKVLAQISEAKKNPSEASMKYKLALEQAEDVITRLTHVGNISSQIRIDEIEGSFLQKNVRYQRERMWLIFAVIIAVLVILIITIIYRSMRQKRHYEKLLYATQKEELAFINSHEVRRHLSNILGIIDLIKNSDDRQKEYEQIEDLLFCSAENMDQAIKNISAKLDEQLPKEANLPI